MLQCRRFYTDKNFKNRIITNSYSLRNLKNSKKIEDFEKESAINIPQKSNINLKRLNTSNSMEKKIRNKEKDDEKIREKLKLKRESSLRARKLIISRIKNSKDLIEEIKFNEKKENIKKIEIKIKEEHRNYKRVYSDNDISFGINFKKKLEKNENKNPNDNYNNKNNINAFITNYGNKIKIDNSKIMNNIEKNDYLLNKNIRHIYKKNIIKTAAFKEKHSQVLNYDRKDDFKNDNNINKKFISNKEKINIVNKNTKIHFLEIKPTNISNINYRNNNNLNKRFHTEENIKKFLISKINNKTKISDNFEQKYIKLKKNCPNNLDKNIHKNNYNNNNKINKLMLKRIKISKNNDNNKDNFLSYYNDLATKGKRKSDVYDENNKSSTSFKLETYNNKTYIKNRINNKSNKINLKVLQNKNNLNNIQPEKIDIEDKEKPDKKDFQIKFFENLIKIIDSIENKDQFSMLIHNLNKKYFTMNNNTYNEAYNIIFVENENLEYVFKHLNLVLTILIFFSIDDTLYNLHQTKVKEILNSIISSCLNYIETDLNHESNIINDFNKSNKTQINVSIHRYVSSLINLLFNKRNEYLPLKEAFEQIHSKLSKQDFIYILKIINESILFCYNSKPKVSSYIFPFFNLNNNLISPKSKKNFDINNDDKVDSVPFIKSPMSKKFCLVLDIDETISHTLKLNYGGYFLLRPGAKQFLEEVSKYYEIIIFTSSPKKYADKILDKIDINNNIFSHRLYKNHVLYENGKTIKNLHLIGRDLTKTIFIDNLRSNAKYNLDNLCPITTWKGDIFDNRLIKLKDKLTYIATCGKFDDDITQGI